MARPMATRCRSPPESVSNFRPRSGARSASDRQWSEITDWKSELAPFYDQARRSLDAGLTVDEAIAALDPASADAETIGRLLEAGVNVVSTAAFINGRRLGPDRDRLQEATVFLGAMIRALLAVVAAALGAFVYFYEIRGEEGRDAALAAEKRLFPGVDPDAVDGLTLVGSDGRTVRLARSEGSWRVEEPLVFPADGFAVDALAGLLVGLKLAGLKTRVEAIRVVEPAFRNESHIRKLCNELCEKIVSPQRHRDTENKNLGNSVPLCLCGENE